MALVPRESVPAGDSGHDHVGMDHADRDHSEMGFMSMVEVTKDLPRSPDGLPMDWIEVPFGPLFPGLPGGLLLTLTLDGDAVAKAHAQSLVGGAGSLPATGMEATRFVDHLGAMDPLTPVAYRLLACRALEAATGRTPDQEILRGRVVALERERIASHLGWLAQLGRQTGFAWLERHAARMQLECLRADLPGIMRLRPAVHALAGRLARTPLLRSRLSGIGPVASAPGLRGPVARAAGMWSDARTTDETYNALSFRVMRRKGGDALDRLRIRLEEMRQSLALIQSAGVLKEPASVDSGAASGEGQATVETPRGEARLNLILDSGRVIQARLDTPSTFHMSLLPDLLAQQELGDALTTVCSLDLSPWEVVA
ncbi:NADH-quinone oxidoreductase subunit D-related protein [Sulfuriferula plumbiphila]